LTDVIRGDILFLKALMMSLRSGFCVAFLGLILILGFLSGRGVPQPLAAPDQAKPAQDRPAPDALRHEVSVSLKLVQVHVLGPKGGLVTDLEKSDFIVLDNGKPQTITAFEKHFVQQTELTLGETRTPPARDTAALLNRKFVFLIDFESNSIWGISQSVKTAREFLETKTQPGDEVSLFSFSSIRGLILHEYFTSDADKIRAALGRVMDVPGVPAGSSTGAAITGHSVMGMEALDTRDTIGTVLQQRSSGQRFSKSLTDLSQVLKRIPGQKNIILFSRGLGRSVQIPGSQAERDFQAMGRALASAGAPVFTVESSVGYDELMAKSVLPEYSLARLSEMTGGRYFTNVSYMNEITEGIQSVAGNYYVLGYSIASTWDGKFHDVKVEVKRPGHRVYAPRGYFNPQPFASLTPVEKHLHLLELALGEKTSPDLRIEFPLQGLPFSENKGRPNVLLLSRIPVPRIIREIGAETELISLVFDENKSIAASRRMDMDWRAFHGDSLVQYSAEALAPGRYDCRIVLRHKVTGAAAVGSCSVVIANPAGARLMLYPPVLLDPAGGSAVDYLNVEGSSGSGAAAVSLPGVFPLLRKGDVPSFDALKSGAMPVEAVLRVGWSGPGEPTLNLSVWLVAEGREEKIPVSYELQAEARQEGASILRLSLTWAVLSAGRYSLHISAEEFASGERGETSAPLLFRVN
jgi:VWFA-related protein